MNRAQTVVTGAAALLILVMLVYPPYFGLDVESAGTVHASIGYHPIWSPPGSEYVCHALNPEAAEVCTEDVSAYDSRLNKVQLFLQLVLVLLVVAVMLQEVRRHERAA
jgi:predicted nucleic acid-binding Zn ribbon protein